MTPREVARQRMAAAFTEWERRYREDPHAFWSDVEKLLGHTPNSYGEAAAAYFEILLDGLPEVAA